MTVAAGSRLGPYEIIAPLGVGGMGEVFKARDTRLDRSVAIKVLPAELAENAQFKIRFEREAKTISQLNHPHICTLYDVGDGYLVMELLDGETLADKVARGPMPLDQTIRYGIEIAEALEKAHKAGVVHRDLKPGNIMITKSGAKLLDFGLAKPEILASHDAATALRPLTAEGTIVGTLNYMAPEQLEGGTVDARTDIFALGAVLFEMATGKRAFEGKSKASLIASILAAEPKPVSALQPMTPASLDRIVRLCLEKEPDERWQSAHDIAIELRAVKEAVADRRPVRTAIVPWIVAGLFAVAAITSAILLWNRTRAERLATPVRTYVMPPDNATFDFLNAGAPPAISPDGKRIVFGAVEAGRRRVLYMRSLDSLAAQPLAGTEDATFPFWSPDGRYVGFFADNALKKIEVSGGGAVTLCTALDGRGASWSPDGTTIVFAGRYSPIYRVPAAGGNAVEVTKIDSNETSHRYPEFLPDSRHFLYLRAINGSEDPANRIWLGNVDGTPGKALFNSADEPHYLNGSIVFTRDRILMAQPFDEKALTIVGEPVPLKEQRIEGTALFARNIVSVARNGTLLYQIGSPQVDTRLEWIDRTGKVLGAVGEPAPVASVVLSPDEKSLALKYTTPTVASNLWLIDLVRGAKTRVTFSNAQDSGPLWSQDGRKIVYTSTTGRSFVLLLKDLASGKEQELFRGDVPAGVVVPTSWSPDGKAVLYSIGGRSTRGDVYWFSFDDRKPHPLLATPFIEGNARFSPDGHWIAYYSDESGRAEIYVAPFPPTGAKWQVSAAGGIVPRWRSDGKELFYVKSGEPASMWAVPLTLGAQPEIGRGTKLFDFTLGAPGVNMYDVDRSGQRFLVNTRAGEARPPAPLVVVQHFDNELRDAFETHQ